jgi:hypothetical protein
MKRAITLAIALVGAHANAQTAPTKRQCADAYTQAQVLRSQDKLMLAKEQIDLCNDPACPQALRKDCTEWLVEVQDSVPTLAVDVDVSSARVTIDGHDVANGVSVPLDPGSHAIVAEAAGLEKAMQTVTLLQGEKRHVTLTLAAPPAPTKIPETRIRSSRPFPVAPIVVGVAGLALVGGFAAFGLVGNAKRSDLDASGCATNCSPGDLDAIRTDYIVGDVLLGLGITAVAIATVWLILHETASTPRRAMAWRSLGLII